MSTDRILTLGFVIPGDLNAPTGGSRYDREVLTRFANHPINARVLGVSSRYPFPTLEDRKKTAALLSNSACDLLLIDGLAFGAFSEIERAAMTSLPYTGCGVYQPSQKLFHPDQCLSSYKYKKSLVVNHCGTL